MIDLHMHLLPGLDDGPSQMEETLEMCRLAVKDGTRTVAATPHMCNGIHRVSREDVWNGLSQVRSRLRREDLDLELVPGADVHLHPDLPRLLEEGRVMTLGDTGRYLLLEPPAHLLPDGLDRFCFDLRLQGTVPIITHPERNLEVQARPEAVVPLAAAGALMQITAGSLTGAFGRAAHGASAKLLEMGLVHLVASDAHSAKGRAPGLRRAFALVESALGSFEAETIFCRRPARILAGMSVIVEKGKRKKPFAFLGTMFRPGKASAAMYLESPS